jgi:hypothetical protein
MAADRASNMAAAFGRDISAMVVGMSRSGVATFACRGEGEALTIRHPIIPIHKPADEKPLAERLPVWLK